MSLSGCSLLDSPTEFDQQTPVWMASDGDAVIFKTAGESDTCVLTGGTVLFTARDAGSGSPAVRFSYRHSSDAPPNDVAAFTSDAGTLRIDGRGHFSLTRGAATPVWRDLSSVRPNGEQVSDKRATVSIASSRPEHFIVRLQDERHRDIFSGTVISADGTVFIRRAVFSALLPAYHARSEHNCGNWDSAAEATKALRRIEDGTPP